MRELRRLGWLEQNYNLILMGPSGTGKTFIAAGLVYEAAGQGYKAYMVTMEDVINTIKMKTLMPSAMSAYNRLLKADQHASRESLTDNYHEQGTHRMGQNAG